MNKSKRILKRSAEQTRAGERGVSEYKREEFATREKSPFKQSSETGEREVLDAILRERKGVKVGKEERAFTREEQNH